MKITTCLFATCLTFAGYAATPMHAALAQSTVATAPSAAARTAIHTSGTVAHYILTPMGRVRGLVLNGDTVVFVHGRGAHTLPARALPGTVVQVDGFTVAGQRNTIHRATVRDADGHVLVATPPERAAMPVHLDATARARRDRARAARIEHIEELPTMTVSGTVRTVLSDARGAVHGVLLADGTSIAIAHTLGREIGAHGLRAGETLSVVGHGATYPSGPAVLADEVTFADGAMVRSAAHGHG